MSFRISNKMQPQKRLKDKISVDDLPAIDGNDPSNGESTARNTENGAIIPGMNVTSSNRKRKHADSSTKEDANENQPNGVGVCRLELGNYSAMFEPEDIIESHTLHLLVQSNARLDSDDQDVCRIHGAPLPTASLNPPKVHSCDFVHGLVVPAYWQETEYVNILCGPEMAWSVSRRWTAVCRSHTI
jgi:hypothetical protein